MLAASNQHLLRLQLLKLPRKAFHNFKHDSRKYFLQNLKNCNSRKNWKSSFIAFIENGSKIRKFALEMIFAILKMSTSALYVNSILKFRNFMKFKWHDHFECHKDMIRHSHNEIKIFFVSETTNFGLHVAIYLFILLVTDPYIKYLHYSLASFRIFEHWRLDLEWR